MFKKIVKKNVIFILVIFLFISCDSIKLPLDLAKSPLISDEEERIREIILKNAPHSTIISPQNNKTFNRIDENFVCSFYKSNEKVGIILIKKEKDKWYFHKKYELKAVDIDYFNSFIFDDKQKILLLVGFVKNYNEAKQLEIFDLNLNEIHKDLYTNILVDNFVDDIHKELMVFNLLKEEKTLKMYRYSSNKMILIDKMYINENVDSYYNLISGKINKDSKNHIFLDFKFDDIKYATLVLNVEDFKLNRVFQNNFVRTIKSMKIKSKDINDDNIIDIASDYFFTIKPNNLKLYKWVNFYDYKEDMLSLSYIFMNGDFAFLFDKQAEKMLLNSEISIIEKGFNSVEFLYQYSPYQSVKIMSIDKIPYSQVDKYFKKNKDNNLIMLQDGQNEYYACFYKVNFDNVFDKFTNDKLLNVYNLFLKSIDEKKVIF